MYRMPATLVAVLMTVAAASAATDLQRAKALNDQANALLDRKPVEAFDGDEGEVYCAWLVRLYPIQDELLTILERNPTMVGIGSTQRSHAEIVELTKRRLAAIESERVRCAAADLQEQLDDFDDLDEE